MSRLGGVVLIGRGGSFILGPRQGFHIRVICPREKRIEYLMKYTRASESEARKSIDESDTSRREFIEKLFKTDINDPHHYDMVINTESIDIEELVDTAVCAINGKMDKLAHLYNDPSPNDSKTDRS
jgi:cytidylate kinase